jgi:hypothetical protein
MSKAIMFLFGLFLSASLAAQTCDMNVSMSMSHNGAVKMKNAAEYKGLTAAEAADIFARNQSVINEATKAQKKGGEYTFDFEGTNTCGLPSGTMKPVEGLSHKESTKVWRQAFKVAEGTIKMSEKHASKGGKGPWGK